MKSSEDKPVQESSGRSGYSCRRWSLLGLLLVAVPVVAPMLFAQDAAKETFSQYVDAKGNISLPQDFETEFAHLGTIAVASKKDQPVDQLHVTYTRAEDIRAFQENGKFSDGAIMVKAVRNVNHEKLTTGQTSYASDVKVWFVMVKDAKGRFPDNELWGDGWGWGLFNGDDRTKQVAVNYKTECRSCHVPVRKTDWVYTQCYPALAKAVKPTVADAKPEPTASKPDLLAMFPQWKEAVSLKGNAAVAKEYFLNKTINTSMTCASCHSFDRRDTMQADGDGLVRAGFSLFASTHRTNIKGSGTNLAALGGNVCVIHFMKGAEPGMTAQELADMNAFLASGGDATHPTAKNVDYANAKWTIPKTLTGGNANKGAQLAAHACITCHDVDGQKSKFIQGGGPLEAESFGVDDLGELALQIRNPDYKHNEEMPGYTDLRLSNEQLLDVIAWLTNK